MRNYLWKTALLMAASLALFACDNDKEEPGMPPEAPETIVTLDREELSLQVGESATLVATVTPPPGWCEDRLVV